MLSRKELAVQVRPAEVKKCGFASDRNGVYVEYKGVFTDGFIVSPFLEGARKSNVSPGGGFAEMYDEILNSYDASEPIYNYCFGLETTGFYSVAEEFLFCELAAENMGCGQQSVMFRLSQIKTILRSFKEDCQIRLVTSDKFSAFAFSMLGFYSTDNRFLGALVEYRING